MELVSKNRGSKGKRMRTSLDLGLPSKCLVLAADMEPDTKQHDDKNYTGDLTKESILPETILKDLNNEIANLELTLGNYNSFDMISALSFKELACNPETYREYDHDGMGAVVEYISLLYLKHPFCEGRFPVDSHALVLVSDMAKRIFSIDGIYCAIKAHHDSIDKPIDGLDELKYFSVNNETFIRNPSYQHLLKRAIIGIFSPLNKWFLENLGFTIDDALIINNEIESFINFNLSAHRDSTIKIEQNLIKQLRKYRSTKKIIDETNYDILNELGKCKWSIALNKLRIYVSEKSLSSFGSVYGFTAKDLSTNSKIPIERVESYLDILSIRFGSIDSKVYMLSPTHELKSRPFICQDGLYLCPNPQLLLSSLQLTLEKVLNPDSSEAINKNRHIWDKYIDIRAYYIETETNKMIQNTLKYAKCYNNLIYKFAGGSSPQYELDGLIIFDSNLLLIECKAGNFTQSARRGSKERLLKDIKSLIIDAHNQALRAKKYLDSTDSPRFFTRDRHEVFIDKTKIKKTFLINVTLEQLDAFTVALNKTAKLGLFNDGELPWAVSFFDLMVICDMIEFPSQMIHYLERRLALNELDHIAAHDELDWFGNYIHEGLYFSGINDTRLNQVYLTTHTTEFDDYYMYKNCERKTKAPKPKQDMPRRFHDIISEIDASQKLGHSDLACKLLDMDYRSRKVFSEQFDVFRNRSSRDKRMHDFSLVLNDEVTKTKSGVSCFVLPDKSSVVDGLNKLKRYIRFKKHQMNAESWLGFITVVDDTKLINSWIIE